MMICRESKVKKFLMERNALSKELTVITSNMMINKISKERPILIIMRGVYRPF